MGDGKRAAGCGGIAGEVIAELRGPVFPSWIDVAPDSPFLQKLFAKPLPKMVAYYLLFSVVGGNGTDGAVPITSELSLRAQADATHIYGFSEKHTSILRSNAAILRVRTHCCCRKAGEGRAGAGNGTPVCAGSEVPSYDYQAGRFSF